ncbi:hypothetical protein O3M35_012315 [Rhynocoris fuscipes]|uniref:Uncharacterized protein n=1 Tax=Rhynocoris fuscipes TaxID=488301 RepID=A0AAW1CTL0_9HEMI
MSHLHHQTVSTRDTLHHHNLSSRKSEKNGRSSETFRSSLCERAVMPSKLLDISTASVRLCIHSSIYLSEDSSQLEEFDQN